MTKQEKFNLIDEKITEEILADVYCAEWGETLSIYEDQININQYMLEIDPAERPFAQTSCPGLGNNDTDFWVREWTQWDETEQKYRVKEDGRLLTLEECIRECCEIGDIFSELEELKNDLKKDVEMSSNEMETKKV